MESTSSNSHETEFQNKPVFKNNNKPESESSPISLSSSSSFCRHLQQFPIFFKFEKLFLSADYFSPEAEYFIFRQIMFFGSISKSCPRQNSFSKCVMRFYYFISNLKKRFLLSAFGGLSHSGKKTIFSWWLIWMTGVRKVTDSNSYKFITDLHIFYLLTRKTF